MSRNRELSEEKKRAKNERDRQYRAKKTMEFKRMQKKEEELEAEIRSLREEIKWLKDNLKIKDQLHQNYREAHVHNQVLEETRKQVESWFDFDKFPNEEIANNEPSTQFWGAF